MRAAAANSHAVSRSWGWDHEFDGYRFGDTPGLDTVLSADQYHRRWMDEADVRLDLEDAVGEFFSSIQPKYMPLAWTESYLRSKMVLRIGG
jgi:hypothetical protein